MCMQGWRVQNWARKGAACAERAMLNASVSSNETLMPTLIILTDPALNIEVLPSDGRLIIQRQQR